ncbi:MAG: ATP-binding protein [Muribaculaceae bacterium]
MQIYRHIYDYLRSFFKNQKKALLISGARQVGKTFAIRLVGSEVFDKVVELNFIDKPELKSIFENPRSAKDLLLRLSAYAGGNLPKEKTLFFFDEIQECPDIVTAIKFLVDEGSFRYVLSGSLLGVHMKDIRSMPVGYLTEKQMFPLDLYEFAVAVGMSGDVLEYLNDCFVNSTVVDEVVHNKMIELLHLYLVVGGMPEAVVKYLESNNLHDVREVQVDILNMYRKDISRYDINNKIYISEIFDLIPSELDSKNKRFVFKSLNLNSRFEKIQNSFLWLADAGVALPVYNVEEPRLPLRLNKLRSLFKLFLCDVGLLSAFYPIDTTLKILDGQANINYGATYENFVAQELKAHGYALYYFNNKRQGEVDFLVEHSGSVLPIEVKSGKDFKRHNALSNILSIDDYGIKRALVLSNGINEIAGKVAYMPVYMTMFLKPPTLADTVVKFNPI